MKPGPETTKQTPGLCILLLIILDFILQKKIKNEFIFLNSYVLVKNPIAEAAYDALSRILELKNLFFLNGFGCDESN